MTTRRILGLGLLAGAAVGFLAHPTNAPTTRPQPALVAPPLSRHLLDTPPAAAPAPPRAANDGDPLRARFSAGKAEWVFAVAEIPNGDFRAHELQISRNGSLVCRLPAGRLDGEYLAVKSMVFAIPYPVMAVLAFPGAGHPTTLHFYTARNGRLLRMGTVGAENGGPVFQDYDGDGRPEWVFDDYDWYAYNTEGPAYFRIYKVTPRGTLHLWRRLPNPKRRHLPDRIGIVGAYSGTG